MGEGEEQRQSDRRRHHCGAPGCHEGRGRCKSEGAISRSHMGRGCDAFRSHEGRGCREREGAISRSHMDMGRGCGRRGAPQGCAGRWCCRCEGGVSWRHEGRGGANLMPLRAGGDRASGGGAKPMPRAQGGDRASGGGGGTPMPREQGLVHFHLRVRVSTHRMHTQGVHHGSLGKKGACRRACTRVSVRQLSAPAAPAMCAHTALGA